MESTIKTNRLAIVSVVGGLTALLSIIFIFLSYNTQKITGGFVVSLTDGIIIPFRNLCVVVSLITGILALRDIKKKGGSEKGKLLAWVGIVLGAGWIIFGLLVGITFLLAEILH